MSAWRTPHLPRWVSRYISTNCDFEAKLEIIKNINNVISLLSCRIEVPIITSKKFYLHKISSELELSYGNFDVVFFPERLNFFDASQEKFKISISKYFRTRIGNGQTICHRRPKAL